MILMLLVALCSLAACTHADCDACVAGWCHSRKTLIKGFNITDQLAIDHTHNVLYVQLNSNMNSAFFLDDLKIKMVQFLNTSGMAVDQTTQYLYMADYNRNIYKLKYGSSTSELFYVNQNAPDVNLLFFKDELHYTSRHRLDGINIIMNDGKHRCYNTLRKLNLTITDFVLNKNKTPYYVANDKVYLLTHNVIMLVTDKPHVLSTDIHGDVYLADVKFRAIYKLNESDELVEYAAYKTGSVDRFVFDKDNNIVFHDALDGNVFVWKKGLTKCKIHAPQTHFSIEELPAALEIKENTRFGEIDG